METMMQANADYLIAIHDRYDDSSDGLTEEPSDQSSSYLCMLVVCLLGHLIVFFLLTVYNVYLEEDDAWTVFRHIAALLSFCCYFLNVLLYYCHVQGTAGQWPWSWLLRRPRFVQASSVLIIVYIIVSVVDLGHIVSLKAQDNRQMFINLYVFNILLAIPTLFVVFAVRKERHSLTLTGNIN